MLAEKYKPHSLKEFVGQKDAVNAFIKFMKTKSRKGLLFYGPPGVGKTALVEAYARENNVELMQMNASDVRDEEEIMHILGNASRQTSLFNRKKIILIDEVDSISGREDKGGVGAIIYLIKESSYPVMLIANNPWNQRLRPLRQHCSFLELKRLHLTDVQKKLEQIASTEKIIIDRQLLHDIAKKSRGDMRSAMNDLEIISKGGMPLDERETNKSIFEFLNEVFKGRVLNSRSLNSVDLDPESIFWWIENNIPNEYEKPEEIARAYEALSRADLFKQRIRSKQNWRLQSYFIDLMTSGVAVSKKDVYRKFTRYQFPTRFQRSDRPDEQRLVEFSKLLHCSKKKIKLEYLPFWKSDGIRI